MRTARTIALVFLSSWASVYSQSLDDLAITVKGESREFSFTNKHSAVYYGETNKKNASGWMGFSVFGVEFLDDYVLTVNGVSVRREAATVVVYPDYLERRHPDGVVEQLRMVDSLAMFALILTSPTPVEFGVTPLFSDGTTSGDYEIVLEDGAAAIARSKHKTRTTRENYPVWIVIAGSMFTPVLTELRDNLSFSPVQMHSTKSKTMIVAFSVADTKEEALHTARSYTQETAAGFFRHRRNRMELLLKESRVETADREIDRALAWAKLSLDALIMNQVTKGIFAGLPWFNNYWGRDTFISLPGATLVTGRFREAREILRSFGEFQQRDSSSTDYGRIPNIVTTTHKSFNTADGTPRFVMMIRDYILRSGDSLFLDGMYPLVLRAAEGTLRYHVDSLGFLTHGDAETWMDAVGPNGPWTPRGNRANDIQALWAAQLEASVWCATQVGDVISATRWQKALEKVRSAFTRYFVIKALPVDHLNADGSPDPQLRPNSVFATGMVDDAVRTRIVETAVSELTFEYGVSSLSQNDSAFHPYHEFSLYPKDAAYHNGTVWTWLQGPLISELCDYQRQDRAFLLTGNAVHQILERGAVGTQSELLDAIPLPGTKQPRLSGTFSQAWNLAEFIRNFYDDYLGIRIERYNHRMFIRPRLPASFGAVRTTINMNGVGVPIEMTLKDESGSISIDGRRLRVGGEVILEVPRGNGQVVRTKTTIPKGSSIQYSLQGTSVTVTCNRQSHAHSSEVLPRISSLNAALNFAKPRLTAGLRSMKGPDHALLTHNEIRRQNPGAATLADVADPAHDDHGMRSYTYPSSPHFHSGSLDLTRCIVTHDSTHAYFTLKFRQLSNPGWHPEYGFQLTFVAIALKTEDRMSQARTEVPHNALLVLDSARAYNRLILVGGGVRVEDSQGKILAEYRPHENDALDPIGNVARGEISISIPLKYLGTSPGTWKMTVLVGAQDDHGGAGLGEFRTVDTDASEWHGGGRTSPDDPNVYDILEIR